MISLYELESLIKEHIKEIEDEYNRKVNGEVRAELLKAKSIVIQGLVDYKNGCGR